MTAPAAAVTDPRTRSDGLGWVTRALFPDSRLVLTIGPAGAAGAADGTGAAGAAGRPGGVGAGWRPVVRYTVLGSVGRPRFLLPVGPRRVRAAALLAFNSLRPAPVRAARAALGTLARTGLLDLARLPLLTGWAPPEVPATDLVLADHLRLLLGRDALYAACGVHPPDPNRKPTLQLFDADGTPRGYAKIGWNDATRALVRTESAALRRLPPPGPPPAHPAVPGLLAAGEWAGRTVAVVQPLPAGVRGVGPAAAPDLAAVLAVARRGGPASPPAPLAGSAFLARLTTAATTAAGAAGPPGVAADGARALAAVRDLGQRYAQVAVEFGDWHGDWVPWNLGVHGDRLVAWDWEHSGGDVPVGFDLVHDAFHRSLVLARRPAGEAARAADEGIARHAPSLRLGPEQCRLLVDGYLIELWLRTWRLAAGGAGWNDALHPHLLTVVEQRLSR